MERLTDYRFDPPEAASFRCDGCFHWHSSIQLNFCDECDCALCEECFKVRDGLCEHCFQAELCEEMEDEA